MMEVYVRCTCHDASIGSRLYGCLLVFNWKHSYDFNYPKKFLSYLYIPTIDDDDNENNSASH